ncbi:MAG: DUF167 domain-containing protein [Acidobacteria bacterium]|nr:DUF167 domain-containing protein [Acidobacteriota bacterium]
MVDSALQIRRSSLGLELRLRVQPRAGRTEIAGVHNGALKLKVTAPPVEDAANRAVIEYLAGRLGISRSKLSILSGAKSRDKVLRIQSLSLEELRKKLDMHC